MMFTRIPMRCTSFSIYRVIFRDFDWSSVAQYQQYCYLAIYIDHTYPTGFQSSFSIFQNCTIQWTMFLGHQEIDKV